MSDNAPGWQPDPTGKHDHRYWDGTQWTDNVADAGVAATDPYEAPAASDVDAPAAEEPSPQPEPPAAVEPTVVQPVAAGQDATAAWPTDPARPAVPPAYVPPSPVGAEGSGGSKRGLLVGGGILAAVAIAVVAFLALGGDDEDVRAQLAGSIERDVPGVSERQAECIADLVVDEAGEDAFKDTDFSAEDPPPEFTEAVLAVGFATLTEECGIDEEALGGTDGSSTDSADESTDDSGQSDLERLRDDCAAGDLVACDDLYFSADLGSDLETFGSTCGGTADPQNGFCEETNGGEEEAFPTDGIDPGVLPDDFEDSLADTFESAYNLDRDKAECLAERMTQAIEEGELGVGEAVSNFYDYLGDCDISEEEIGIN